MAKDHVLGLSVMMSYEKGQFMSIHLEVMLIY
jgi:hypothetical protein